MHIFFYKLKKNILRRSDNGFSASMFMIFGFSDDFFLHFSDSGSASSDKNCSVIQKICYHSLLTDDSAACGGESCK